MFALYSNQSLDELNGNTDEYNITVSSITPVKADTQEIKILIPEGLRDALSVDTTTSARLCFAGSTKDSC